MKLINKGLLSEMYACRYYINKGYAIFLPVDHGGPVDVIVTKGTEVLRLQVKTVYEDSDKLRVNIHSKKGGPKYSTEDVDLLVCIRHNDTWLVPFKDVENETTLVFGTVSGKPYRVRGPFRHEQYKVTGDA